MNYPLALLPVNVLLTLGLEGVARVYLCPVARCWLRTCVCTSVYDVQLELKHVIAHPRAIQYFRVDLHKQYSAEVKAHQTYMKM